MKDLKKIGYVKKQLQCLLTQITNSHQNIGVIYGSVVSYGKIQLKRIGPKRHGLAVLSVNCVRQKIL